MGPGAVIGIVVLAAGAVAFGAIAMRRRSGGASTRVADLPHVAPIGRIHLDTGRERETVGAEQREHTSGVVHDLGEWGDQPGIGERPSLQDIEAMAWALAHTAEGGDYERNDHLMYAYRRRPSIVAHRPHMGYCDGQWKHWSPGAVNWETKYRDYLSVDGVWEMRQVRIPIKYIPIFQQVMSTPEYHNAQNMGEITTMSGEHLMQGQPPKTGRRWEYVTRHPDYHDGWAWPERHHPSRKQRRKYSVKKGLRAFRKWCKRKWKLLLLAAGAVVSAVGCIWTGCGTLAAYMGLTSKLWIEEAKKLISDIADKAGGKAQEALAKAKKVLDEADEYVGGQDEDLDSAMGAADDALETAGDTIGDLMDMAA